MAAPAQELYQKLQAKMGMVPTVFRAMGEVPEVLAATLALESATETNWNQELRELAYLAASHANQCSSCVSYHERKLSGMGLPAEKLANLENHANSPVYSEMERIVLQFVGQWQAGKIDDQLFKEIHESLGEDALIRLSATVSLTDWINRFSKLAEQLRNCKRSQKKEESQ